MKRSILVLMVLVSSTISFAHDFSVRLADGQQLYFNITDAEKNLVELTYPAKINNTKPIYTGKLTIPATVQWNNKVYKVTAVGKKAFVNDTNLTDVVMPSGLTKIDDFAFEGCTSLRSIIFPGNKVTFGSGTFFRCSSVENVTFGGDWTTFDMKVFRWSKNLNYINLPAKMEKIINLKSLKCLKGITVDVNNRTFSAIDGVLYDKAATTLLCCPRDYGRYLVVPTGVIEVRWGAISDCQNIQTVVLPTTLLYLSYREFANMQGLKQIVMKNPTPIITAQKGNARYFLLMIPDNAVNIYVAKNARKAYVKKLAPESGNYSEIEENLPLAMDKKRAVVPFVVRDIDLPSKWNIKGVSDFSSLTF